ncbi:MAG: hypothetical protein HZC48_04885 [Nitrospirae bacterium]|nr:hypothetical protein [Nitrospirota bacterium]
MWTFKKEAKFMILLLIGMPALGLLFALCSPRVINKVGAAKQQVNSKQKLAHANGVQMFNASVLGQCAESKMHILSPEIIGNIKPLSIQLDIENNIIIGANVTYSAEVTYDLIKGSLTEQYGEPSIKDDSAHVNVWRNEKDKFSVMLSNSDNNFIQVIYLKFKDNDEVLKDMMKAYENKK